MATFDVYPKLYRDNTNRGINYDYVMIDNTLLHFTTFLNMMFNDHTHTTPIVDVRNNDLSLEKLDINIK